MADTRDSLNSTQEQLRRQQADLKEQKRLQKELARSQRKLARAQKRSNRVKAVNRIRQEGMWTGPVLLLNDKAVPVEFVDRPEEVVGTVGSRNEVPKEEPKYLDYTSGRKFRVDYIIEDGDYYDAVCRIPEKPDMFVWCHSYNPFTGEWSGNADIGLSKDDVMERLVGRTIIWDNTSTTSHASSNIRRTNKKAIKATRAPKKPVCKNSNSKNSGVDVDRLARDMDYAYWLTDPYDYGDQFGFYPSEEGLEAAYENLQSVEGVDSGIGFLEDEADPDEIPDYDDLLARLKAWRREMPVGSKSVKSRSPAKTKSKSRPRVAYDRANPYGRR